jgi:integrase
MTDYSSSGASSGKAPRLPDLARNFPLRIHKGTGYWHKKVRGRVYYFGKVADDPKGRAALDAYFRVKADLEAGRRPRVEQQGAVTIATLVDRFINVKRDLLDSGELSHRTLAEYQATTDLLSRTFGKQRLAADLYADDFTKLRKSMALKWGPHRLAKIIQYIRSVFKFGFESGLIERPVLFGSGFKRPSKKTLRLHRAERGPKLLSRDEVRRLIDNSGPQLKAMILLGINCGFGNTDCGSLPISALDLEAGWVNYPRPKTGVARRCPLWPETIDAIRRVLAKRATPRDAEDADLVFITKYGRSWAKDTSTNPISQEMKKILKSLNINGRQGLGFYTLRHTFRTVSDEARDQPAIDFIMGHARDDMASLYREAIADERMLAVTAYVRTWLGGWGVASVRYRHWLKSLSAEARSALSSGQADATTK